MGRSSDFTSESEWDRIENEMASHMPRTKEYEEAKALFEIKYAKQQLKINEIMVKATSRLSIYTLALVVAASLTFAVSIMGYLGSRKQAEAINSLAIASERQVEAIERLSETIEAIEDNMPIPQKNWGLQRLIEEHNKKRQ